MLVALQRREVDFILIGGLARVARGADEITRDLDICPSLQPISLGRLQAALIDLGVVSSDVIGGPPLQHVYDEARLRAEKVVSLPTVVAELKLEADRAALVTQSIRTPGSTQSLRRPRDVGSDRGRDPDVGR